MRCASQISVRLYTAATERTAVSNAAIRFQFQLQETEGAADASSDVGFQQITALSQTHELADQPTQGYVELYYIALFVFLFWILIV